MASTPSRNPRPAPAKKPAGPADAAQGAPDDEGWAGLVLADNCGFPDPAMPATEVAYAKGTALLELPEEHAMLARGNPLLVAYDEGVALAQQADADERAKAPTQRAQPSEPAVVPTDG